MNESPKNSQVFCGASWIASPVVGGPRSQAPAPYLRKTIFLGQSVQSAQLSVTALGLYECEINGRKVGDEVFAPGWTDYHKRVYYQVHDVTGYLRAGENVVGAILGDGWYCGFLAWGGRQTYGDRPRILARLEVVLQDGSIVNVPTDLSWKTTTGPILDNDLLMGESYDARLELGDWSQPGFDESRWQSVIMAPPDTALVIVPRVGPPVRRMGEIKPVSVREMQQRDKIRIYDLGQNFSGRIKMEVRAARGTTLKFRFAETLNPDGTIYTDNLRAARCTDYYTCKGIATESWESRFTFHGFRHVEVTGLGPGDHLEIAGVVLHSDTPPTGQFRCSHNLLNQLQHNIIWGQKSNFIDVPTDCPQRDERLGWTGDAQVFIRTAAFNMDVRQFFHKWIQDIRDAQGPRGGIPCVVPTSRCLTYEDGGGAWSDATIICPWTIYLCYADRTILEEHYDSMKFFMEFVAKHRCVGLIRAHPDTPDVGNAWFSKGIGDWLALDGGGDVQGITPHDLIGTAFYAYDADIMAKVAQVLGRQDEAENYRRLHAQIVEAFRRRFITPDGLVVSGTQTAYVLALHFGLVEESMRATTARELVRSIEKKNYHIGTGFVGTPYILDVLENVGRLDVAYKLLEQETFPSWLFPIHNGATTIWERWDGWTPDKGFQNKGMNSFNHYAYGAVGAWMYRTVAGLELDPQEPGYAHILFRPRPGGSITWAEARLQTAFGTAGIRWELKEEVLHVQLAVPAGCRATFLPPPGYTAETLHYQEGHHTIHIRK